MTPHEAIAALLPLLHDSFEAGVANNGCHRVEKLLPEGSWRWTEYEQQSPELNTYDVMMKTLVNRIWRLASSLWQYQRILRNKESFPYLKLDTPDARKAKPECVALDFG
ncbi:hypothetical protein [Nitrosomonas sp. Is37]|uniref:hypothetical protein n=1 Tax=Nitrosomonas sp. Is37 TaxID=3080535 RepID=UPI00294AE692|nr:hypothetical protein [Nitrosomonas sp. Is37]MDV6345568.1 hypothetical protein [Nitrosomonas sp. Is37]